MNNNIIRVQKTSNYSIISNECLNDPNISFKAKGLLCYLLSKPDHWNVNTKQLEKVSTDGRDSIYATINELISSGYVAREGIKDKGGKFTGYQYTVFERPVTDIPDTVEPVTGKPDNSNNLFLENTEVNNAAKQKIDFEDRKIAFLKLLIDWVGKHPAKYPIAMYVEFAEYWVEATVSKKKMRFEDEKFFEIGRRLATWFGNCNETKLREHWKAEEKSKPLNVILRNLLTHEPKN